MRGQLQGMTAFVTGASSGIGLATARLLAEDGAAVLMMGRREDALKQCRDDIAKQIPGARLEIFAGDATEKKDVKAALARAHAMANRLDIVVPAVGGGGFAPVLLVTVEMLLDEYKRNVVSAFLAIKHGVPLMKPGGSIVCISTTTVVEPFRGIASYASANAALERLVRSAADELGDARIRVNSVRPGLVRSAATTDFYTVPGLLEDFLKGVPLGRSGEPEDIARVVRFVAGPEGAWVNGQNFAADGGQAERHVPDMQDMLFGKDVMDMLRVGKIPPGKD